MTKTISDVLAALKVASEIHTSISDATEGTRGVDDVVGVRLREVSASASRDGVAYWVVEAVMDGLEHFLKAFSHSSKQAAVVYGEQVADALGLELSR